MFDVNQPESLDALHRWWAEFCERAPLLDEEMEDFCCVVVGNKVDVSETLDGPAVSEADALSVINELVPPSSPPSTPPIPFSRSDTAALPYPVLANHDDESELPEIIFPPLTSSITIGARHHKQPSKSRSRSSHFRFPNGTMTTTHTTLTSYHTPSSSYFDVFESARSSPVPRSSSPSLSRSESRSPLRRPRHMVSSSTLSTSSAPTITPSLFARTAAPTPPTPPPGTESDLEADAPTFCPTPSPT
ncbi:hypothetical protein EW146_g5454 [Bondarzewia mesenterica]|uniref:Uncharacterized protein n=1 Tax=Bondarzewia mesenterica TaxID=1095465 RepID=A0A4S4LTI7_9AGAM|nr:hypothetical protein EW146_g5454 [Bondarzewia mesenterica]